MFAKYKWIIIVCLVVGISALSTFWFLNNRNENMSAVLECPPGQKLGGGKKQSCYTPSEFEGKPCDNRIACGGVAECVLVDATRDIGKGICVDRPSGCISFIDEEGNFSEDAEMCID